MTDLDIYGLYFARKPSTKAMAMALNIMDVKKEETVLVGDQLFTDVLGANRFGIKSILVNPLSKKEGIYTSIKRPFERMVMKKLEKESAND